ncbi:MAG: hypothetical protein LBI62_02950 [Candidatus Accumulibacter sp.]|jgi:hypothetical protein|nr:hypothetical protein [Accumulibacter sp.]
MKPSVKPENQKIPVLLLRGAGESFPLPGCFCRGSVPGRCSNAKLRAQKLALASAKPTHFPENQNLGMKEQHQTAGLPEGFHFTNSPPSEGWPPKADGAVWKNKSGNGRKAKSSPIGEKCQAPEYEKTGIRQNTRAAFVRSLRC